jgi:hypothetical protein
MTIAINKHQSNMQMAILIFGVAEICIGLAGAIAADFTSVFNLLALLSGIAGLVAVTFCVLHPASIKVYDILGMALMLAYGTGTLNSLVSCILDNKDLLLSSSVSEYWLSRTLGLTTAAAGFLHIVGRLDSKGYLFVPLDFKDFQVNRALLFVGSILAVSLIFIATGKLGFMADVASVEGYVGISASTSLVLDMMTPAGALALYLGRKVEQRNIKILFFAVATILLLIQFGLGRRIFVFSLLIYVLTAILAKRPEKIISVRNIVMMLIIVMLVQAATSAFFIMRMARYSFKATHKTPSIVEMIPEAIKVFKDRERLYIAEQIQENLSSRTFVLEYLATLSERTSVMEPTYGQNLLRAAVVATPIILYWGKYKNPLFTSEEDVLNTHFRIPVSDAANTVLTGSVGDFGEIGFFVLPVLVCLILSLFLRLSYSLTPAIAGMLISFLVCKTLLFVEADMVSYLTSMRSILIFIVILYFVFRRKKTNLSLSTGAYPS